MIEELKKSLDQMSDSAIEKIAMLIQSILIGQTH